MRRIGGGEGDPSRNVEVFDRSGSSLMVERMRAIQIAVLPVPISSDLFR